MNKKVVKEWFVEVPWGKVALISWGESLDEPVLLAHGYMDTAATFIPLLEHLPDTYYYVGIDFPGHGKSDPFPPGLVITQLLLVEVVHRVVQHLKWTSFIYLSHSMGFIMGTFYQHLYPGNISKMVHIDPGPPIAMYFYPHHKPKYWFQFIDGYYSNYERWNSNRKKQYTYEEAINLLVRNRSISEDKAELVMSRSLIPVGNGKYELSWEPRMKKISTVPVSEEILFTIIAQDIPPTLVIESSENRSTQPGRKFAADILEKCKSMVPNFSSVVATGGHDVHITNPEDIALLIINFLNTDHTKKVKSKL